MTTPPCMSRHNLRSSAPGPGQHQTPGHVEGQPSLIWYTFLYLPDEVPQHTSCPYDLKWVLNTMGFKISLEQSLQMNGFLYWMCSNVSIKIAWIGKWFKTFFTSKRLLSWMRPTMGFKISRWRKWLVTFFTSIWLLSRMGSYVSYLDD